MMILILACIAIIIVFSLAVASLKFGDRAFSKQEVIPRKSKLDFSVRK